MIWVRSRNCDCLVTWFCYQLIAKPGNKTATVPWPDPYIDGLLQDCSTSSALEMELLQSCTEPSICWLHAHGNQQHKHISILYIFFHIYVYEIFIMNTKMANWLRWLLCWHEKKSRRPFPLTHWPLWHMAVIYKLLIFKLVASIDILSTSCKIVLKWIPQHFTDD